MAPNDDMAEHAPLARGSTRSVTPVWLAMVRGVVGGAAAGGLGYYAFFWLLGQGLYALVLPGALVGLGCGLASGRKLWSLGVLAALGGASVAVLADWHSLAHPSATLFGHLAGLGERKFQSLFVLLSAAIAFYFGIGRNRRT